MFHILVYIHIYIESHYNKKPLYVTVIVNFHLRKYKNPLHGTFVVLYEFVPL